MNPTKCPQHEQPIVQICMGSGCRNRLMCEDCERDTQHRFHGRHIRFTLKEAIETRRARYEEKCLQRLNQMIDYLNKKFCSEISALRLNIEREIVVRSRTEFAGAEVSPVVLSWMAQIEQNCFTGLDEKQLDEVCEVLANCESNVKVQQVTAKEMKKLEEIVCEAFKQVRLTERVYWSQPTKPKSADDSRWPSRIFESLILKPQDSMSRLREEAEHLMKSLDSIAKSVEVKGEERKLNLKVQLKKNKEILSQVIRSDRIEWQNLTELNISGCGIVFLDSFIHLRADNLRALDLSNNEICSIEPLLVVTMLSLQKFSIDNNQLVTLEPFCRVKWPLLKILDLSNNCLTNIQHIEGFDFPYLNYLYLTGNKLRSLRPLEKVVWPRITTIYIKNTMLPPGELPDRLNFRDLTLCGKFWGVF